MPTKTEWRVVCQHEFEKVADTAAETEKRGKWAKVWIDADGEVIATRIWMPGEHPTYRICR